MESVIIKSRLFKAVIAHLKKIITECTIIFNSEGITIRTMDNEVVSYIDFHLTKHIYVESSLTQEVEMSVNLDSLFKMLKVAKDNDQLKLKFSDSILEMEIKNEKTKRKSTHKLKLINIEVFEAEMDDDIDYDCKLDMCPSYFFDICATLNSYNDDESYIKCDMTENTVLLGSEGLVGECSFELQEDAADVEELKINDNVDIKVLSNKFLLFSEASKYANSLQIRASSDTGIPICLEYSLNEYGRVKFYLGSKVEDDI